MLQNDNLLKLNYIMNYICITNNTIVTTSDYDNIIYTDKTKLKYVLQKQDLSFENLKSIVKNPKTNRKAIFFYLDTNNIFDSVTETAKSLHDRLTNDDVCVDISNVAYTYKYILCQYIIKQLYQYESPITSKFRRHGSHCIYFKEMNALRYRLCGILNEFKCADISRDIENECLNVRGVSKSISPLRFYHKIKSLFSKDEHTNVTYIKIGRDDIEITIKFNDNTKYPTICLFGSTFTRDNNMVGGAVICGVVKYFSRYNRLPLNLIAKINVLNGDGSDSYEIDWNIFNEYKPSHVLSFTSTDNITMYEYSVAKYRCSNSQLNNFIQKIGNYVGEKVDSVDENTKRTISSEKTAHFDIVRNNGNIVTLAINLIKHITSKKRHS